MALPRALGWLPGCPTLAPGPGAEGCLGAPHMELWKHRMLWAGRNLEAHRSSELPGFAMFSVGDGDREKCSSLALEK